MIARIDRAMVDRQRDLTLDTRKLIDGPLHPRLEDRLKLAAELVRQPRSSGVSRAKLRSGSFPAISASHSSRSNGPKLPLALIV